MRFAITATDRYFGVFRAFLQAGWEPVRLFTAPTDERVFHNRACIQLAQNLKIRIQMSRMTDRDLRELAAEGCQALIVASYQWRIGEWQSYLPYAVNFHPLLLPHYRGPYPIVNGLLAQAPQWGVTCHKVGANFDSGDILAQSGFGLTDADSHETVDLRSQIAMDSLANTVAGNFEPLWRNATAQAAGSYAPMYSDDDRTLNFEWTVAQNLRIVRAFGRLECLAMVNGVRVYVTRATGWQEAHQVPCGTVVHAYAQANVVACRDGFLALLEWQPFNAGTLFGARWR